MFEKKLIQIGLELEFCFFETESVEKTKSMEAMVIHQYKEQNDDQLPPGNSLALKIHIRQRQSLCPASYPGVYIEEIGYPKTVQGVETSTAAFIGMAKRGKLNKPTLVTSLPEFTSLYSEYSSTRPYLSLAVHGFFANGGKRCYIVRVKDGATENDYIGDVKSQGKQTGLKTLDETDGINLICIPGITSNAVQQALINHCEAKKNRFCILDSERSADIDTVIFQKEKLNSNNGYAALYYPWLKISIDTKGSSINKRVICIPPSGHIAGIYAHNDLENGVHKAPANLELKEVVGLEYSITQEGQGILNPLGINSIRAFTGRGILAWGARTISNDAYWRYVNVRRLFFFLEESIQKGTQWAVFEPNDENLWSRVRQIIIQFLTEVWKGGALAGNTPHEAFFVKCDRTTMTKSDIDNGRVIILIGTAPIKPAEFVIFRITQWAGGSEVVEL